MPEEHEDVEATLEQVTTPDASQQKKKWHAIDCIAGSTLVIEVLLSIIWVIAWVCGYRFEHQLQVYLALVLIILTGGYLALIFCPIFKKDDDPRWFHARILSSGIVGGSYAFLLPAVMSLEERGLNSGGAAALRQAILLATGGLIGLIALGETRRKNDNDLKAANELQIRHEETLDQQKKQFNEQLEEQQKQFNASAFKERKAERRERYTKAVEQLGSQEAPVRMGGVYTLVGLVDEWLEEESIREYEDRLKEGQVIINNLCAYIRSPFTLASHYDELKQDTPSAKGVYQDKVQEFYADKATLDSEADVRLGIIKEIHDRLRGPKEETPGTWSDFEYDFSGSMFFYPVDISYSYYLKSVTFSGSTYQDWTNFSSSIYEGNADFSSSTYEGWANFSRSTYEGWANFSNSTYQDEADFSNSTYEGWANFSRSTYEDVADFSRSTYEDVADLTDSTYEGWANFSRSTYEDVADFTDSTYEDVADFTDSTYEDVADFTDSTYEGGANFSRSTYKDVADFSGSIFYQKVYFGADGDNSSFSRFTDCAPQFYDETNHKNTLFGSHNNDFTVDTDRGYPIGLNIEVLPLGCKFLTSEQKEYLADKFQEIDETKNKFLKVKDPKEKAELSKKLRSLNEELHKWREEVTTVKVEDVVAEDTES